MVAMFLGLKEYLKDCEWESDHSLAGINGDKFTTIKKQEEELKHFEEKYPGTLSFFAHSDCEGEWKADECKKIGGLLKIIISNFSDTNTVFIKNIKEEINQVIKGLEYCSENDQIALFC